MTKKIVFFLLILSCWSCKDDEPVVPVMTINCIEEVEVRPWFQNCDTNPSDFFCEKIFVGEFSLNDEGKFYMPQFCSNSGDSIAFTNESGDIIHFFIANKGFQKVTSTTNTFMDCPSDPDKTVGHCLESEMVFLEMDAPELELELTIRVETKIDTRTVVIGNVGDFISFWRSTGDNSFVGELSLVVDRRTLSYDKTNGHENYDMIELAGRTFTDVISQDITTFVNPVNKYYINKEQGLIGLQDTTGTVWRILN